MFWGDLFFSKLAGSDCLSHLSTFELTGQSSPITNYQSVEVLVFSFLTQTTCLEKLDDYSGGNGIVSYSDQISDVYCRKGQKT